MYLQFLSKFQNMIETNRQMLPYCSDTPAPLAAALNHENHVFPTFNMVS
jgi:hypothetical protein